MFLPPIYCFYDIDLSHLLLPATDSKANPITSRNFCYKQVSLGEGGFSAAPHLLSVTEFY